jgi:AcrR family transcriptional regulator
LDVTAPGRREENKQRTRSALEEAAARLFGEQGFEATTVRDIAAAAGVGERTFFRYFPSKEDLVLQQVRGLIPGLVDRVRARPAGEPPLTALREGMLDWLSATGAAPTILVTGPPKSSAGGLHEAHALKNDVENAFTEVLLDRFEAAGADRADRATVLRAAVQARASVSVIRGLMVAYPGDDCELGEERGLGPRPIAELAELLRQGFAALEE